MRLGAWLGQIAPSALKQPKMERKTDAIIYEMSVRDFTMSSTIKATYPGKFLSVVESGLKTPQGNKAGLDYLVDLGITHVQLMPIYDFATVDELYPKVLYNWGYDPIQYGLPEGSFATNPKDGYSRIRECRHMVGQLHKCGLRVVMDVVYNHMYDINASGFERIVPGYYFRRDEYGNLSNGSWCGNDMETRRFMMRRYIVDMCLRWQRIYGIDGFRFDLMGIIDIDTLNQVYNEVSDIDSNFLMYGEGWNMSTAMSNFEKGMQDNHDRMLNIGFFNDRFRETLKGGSGDGTLKDKGYFAGNMYNCEISAECMKNTNRYSYVDQSINYVECHDNSTLYDKLTLCCPEDTQQDRIKRINIINACCMFSFGVPFFHMGQEIGLSKKGETNSYNLTDEINGLNYQEAYNRREMLRFFKHLVEVRKRLNCFKMYTKEDLFEHISFQNLEKGAIMIKYSFEKEEYYIIFNPSKERFTCTFDRYVKVLFNNTGVVSDSYEFYSQNYLVNGLSVSILYSEK